MEFDELVDKGKKAFRDGTEKIEEVRTSEKAGKVREDVVDGFDKFMRMILPGEHKRKTERAAQMQVEGGEPLTPPREIPSE